MSGRKTTQTVKVLLPLLAAATAMAQTTTRLEHDGLNWVQTVNAPVAVSLTGRLRIATRGHVVLRGATGDQVTYTLTERVKARSEAEARHMLGSLETVWRSDGATLVVLPRTAANVVTELQV